MAQAPGKCADVASLRQCPLVGADTRAGNYSRELLVGDRVIEVVIRRMRRKTIALHVFADRPVELRVPTRCPVAEMERFLASRRDWIAESLEELGSSGIRLPRYVDGEAHAWMGGRYRLRLSEGRRNVSLLGEVMAVRCPEPASADVVRQTIESFYRREAQRLMPERIEACRLRFRQPLPPSTVKIRKMKSRWGSCSSRGEICLNSLLMQKPLAAIDFVVTHELCHLIHFSHSKSFYRLMDQTMPDWRDRERLLVADDATLQLDLF